MENRPSQSKWLAEAWDLIIIFIIIFMESCKYYEHTEESAVLCVLSNMDQRNPEVTAANHLHKDAAEFFP